MTRNLMMIAALAVFQLAPHAAFAQDTPPADAGGGEQKVKYKERTEIDFEQVDVSGELVKPEGTLLIDRKRASFNPLIRLRQDWNNEMKDSVDEVK